MRAWVDPARLGPALLPVPQRPEGDAVTGSKFFLASGFFASIAAVAPFIAAAAPVQFRTGDCVVAAYRITHIKRRSRRASRLRRLTKGLS